MAKTAKTLFLLVLPLLLSGGGVSFAQVQTWTPDTFDPGRAPSIQLPSTPGVPVSGGSSNFTAQKAPAPSPSSAQTSATKPATVADTAPISDKQAKKAPNASDALKPSNKPKPTQKQSSQTANVTRTYVKGMVISGRADVWDGHSLVLDGHPVRLNGIEAPGLAQMCNTASMTVWPCGAKASQRLKQLISGDTVTCRVMDQAGNGAAAVCSTRSIGDLGAMLIAEGLAVPNSFGGLYGPAAQSAKETRKGIFIGSFIHPSRWRLQNPS